MKVSPREIILIILCVFVVGFVGLPTLKSLLPSDEGGASPAELSKRITRTNKEMVRLRGEVKELNVQVERLTWKETPDKMPPIVYRKLQTAARETGVSLTGFRPGRVASLAKGSKLPITVQVDAHFPKAVAFLDWLSAGKDRIALERVQMSSTDASTDRVSVELRLAAYSTSVPTEKKAR